jgi:hypothetical protein
MMGQAGRDPLFWAAFAVANDDATDAGEFCLRCHAPAGWYAGRSDPADGDALLDQDRNAGVACEVCHRMVDPVPGANDEVAALDAHHSRRADEPTADQSLRQWDAHSRPQGQPPRPVLAARFLLPCG